MRAREWDGDPAHRIRWVSGEGFGWYDLNPMSLTASRMDVGDFRHLLRLQKLEVQVRVQGYIF